MEEIITVKMGDSRAYIVKGTEGSILIDAGNKNKIKKFLRILRQNRISPGNIKLIIITHAHFDHVGSLYEIKELTGAKVLIHKKEKKYLAEGFAEIPKGTVGLTKVFSHVGRRMFPGIGSFTAVTPGIVISDDYDLSKYGVSGRVISTPGHTSGSISVHLDTRVAFVGDTLSNKPIEIIYPYYANDEKELISTWARLIQLKCDIYYPGHGSPISLDELEKVYLKKRSSRQ
ncbi:Metallo-beta-lactamase L1 type 3 [subsurface metagenome]